MNTLNRKIYFLLPDYPNWFDGGLKYQTIVFRYFRSKYKKVYAFGKTVEVRKSKNKILQLVYKSVHVLRILIGLYHISRIPRFSVIVLNNAFFLDYSLPAALNRIWKKHCYVMIIHHLVQKDRPTYLRKKLESYFIKHADELITVSNTSKNELIKLSLGRDQTPVVLPGLDVDLNSEYSVKIFPEIPQILYVGTIDVRKGLVYLIEALGGLTAKNFEANFIGRISLDSNYKILQDKIEKSGLKNKVHFLGRVESARLKELYLNSTVFVFPSLWEGYGMAVTEAMAYGLPVVASKIPALQEIVDDSVNGFLIEPGNSAQLANALNLLLSDKDLLEKLSKNAVSKAKTFPKWEDSSEEIWRIVKDHLKK